MLQLASGTHGGRLAQTVSADRHRCVRPSPCDHRWPLGIDHL